MSFDDLDPRKEEDAPDLDWKDYLALVIALLQTTFLPIIFLILVLLGFILLAAVF